MEQVLNILVPIFLLIGMGYGLAKRKFFTQAVLIELNRLLFYICLPALIIHSLATATVWPDGMLMMGILFLSGTSLLILISFPVSRWIGLPRKSVGTFIQSAFRGNLAYAGLPIIFFLSQEMGKENASNLIAQAIFLLAPAMLFYNFVSIFLLLGSNEASFYANIPKTLKKVAKNPLIIAAVIGVGLFLLPFSLPKFALNTLQLTGQIAAPLSLFCVGGGMAYVSLKGNYRSALFASALKVCILPLIVFGLSLMTDLDPAGRSVLLILSACPTAVASYILTKELGGDEALSAGSIVLSTLMSIPSLALILVLN